MYTLKCYFFYVDNGMKWGFYIFSYYAEIAHPVFVISYKTGLMYKYRFLLSTVFPVLNLPFFSYFSC